MMGVCQGWKAFNSVWMGLNCMYHYNMFTHSKIIVITSLYTMHKMVTVVGSYGGMATCGKNTAPRLAAAGQMIDSQDRCN